MSISDQFVFSRAPISVKKSVAVDLAVKVRGFFCRIPKIPRQKCFISCIQGRIEEANITTTQNSSIAGVNFNPPTPKSD